MKNRSIFLFILLTIISGTANMVRAQDTVWRTTDIGILDSLNSNILKEKRLVQVFIPQNYKPGSADKYDVLYVLDGGNWNTGLITKVQRFLEGESYMPPTIIVSVLGIDRNKDLTPTHMDDWKTSGGAGNFLGFIKNELIPYINEKYPSNGDNTLWGHSLGGLFVINALLNEPKTFKSYIAVDPSLWWDNCYIQKIAPDKLLALAGLNITLFISGREGQESESMKITTIDTVLKKMAPAELTWKIVNYPDETHSSIRLKSIYDGLKFSYGWHNGQIEFHPMNGIVLKDKPLKIWYFGDTTKAHYTLDGTEPTVLSAKIQPEINLTDASKITVKQFTNRSRYDKIKTGDFTTEKALKPISKQKNVISGGFHYAYYEGGWDTSANFKDLKPQKTGITNADFDADKLPRKNNYALVIDGLLEAKEDGYYIFVLDADKNSKLYLNNRLLIRWAGSYSNRTYSYILPLEKGFYPLRLEYLHKNEDFKLKLSYLTPSIMSTKNPIPIPLNLQYSHD
ncbi:Predicted hydrolase of the alpha/beta superfamily [Chitinophaga sp. CF118]|uniref:alpha/beta hydrolase-fold protein n=1 Tax=Chitinophaga sp. CF118 TaxID=1884367 RepID=UPI0008ECADD6|nr:alpha/beta hydrolase-fold protein [Chitinophaga sp. CF118]SFD24047.1 Predicted hydrolase of the alpha/beta superfamily [Chitinophaga sp. CF118]